MYSLVKLSKTFWAFLPIGCEEVSIRTNLVKSDVEEAEIKESRSAFDIE